jgi:8-oxo-dGTP pyrophosphatase MutT (NUDIX family)
MALHRDALRTLRSWRADDDPGQEALRRRYVEHLLARPDGTDRGCHPAHLTAGALVVSGDHDHVLLTLHAKARRWFHLGGHCEPADTTLAGVALREATEESGIDGLRLDPTPVHLDAHQVPFCAGHHEVTHLDVRFVAVAPPGAVPAVSEESLDVRWWPADALPTEDPDMTALVRLGLGRLRER